MNRRNGILIEPKRKKTKRATAPNFNLGSKTMIHKKKGSLRLPNFEPVLKLMEESGWEC